MFHNFKAMTGLLGTMLNMVNTLLFELDLIVVVVTLLSTGFVNIVLSKSQTIRPFYPQDATLWNLHTGDTIHTGVVFLILYAVLTPILYLSEQYHLRNNAISPCRRRKSALRMSLGLLSCTMMAILTIELGKGYVGALRPSFARVCLSPREPPYTVNEADIKGVYTSDADCPTTDQHALVDARRSFPSGHAALAVAGSLYGQLVLMRCARTADVSEMAAISAYGFGFAWFLFAAWVSASRIFDAAHHVADVAVGCIVGVWCAVIHFWFVVGRNERAERIDSLGTSSLASKQA